MIIEEIKGDILETDCEYIAHGVNCQNVMGSGVAKVLYTKYPEVKKGYHKFCKVNIDVCIFGQEDFLGAVNIVPVKNKTIFNCFTQEFYGREKKQYVDYGAVQDCFDALALHYPEATIAIPKIGCGLAGGDWDIVKKIINEATVDGPDIYVYYL